MPSKMQFYAQMAEQAAKPIDGSKPSTSMSPPKGSVLDMDERRSSGETDDKSLRLLFL